MRTGRSISMDLVTWTEVETVSADETSDDVSAAIEMLCREALKSREGGLMISDEATKTIDEWMDRNGFVTRDLALQDLLLEFQDRYLGENKIAGV